ncbi:hypothetical protein [Nostoc sp.]
MVISHCDRHTALLATAGIPVPLRKSKLRVASLSGEGYRVKQSHQDWDCFTRTDGKYFVCTP